MIDLIIGVMFCVLVIAGAWNSCQRGMIFGKASAALEERLPKWIYFPLWGCPSCMGSVYGTAVFFLVLKVKILYWPFFCLAVSGAAHLTFETLYRPNDRNQ